MRNLKIIHHAAAQLAPEIPISATAWDANRDSIICATGPSASQQVINLLRISTHCSKQNSVVPIASWDAPSPHPELEVDSIVDLHHLTHSDISCLVLQGGDIIVVRGECLPGQEKIEIVGTVDVGIAAAAWSPDEEFLALITKADTLLFMTADFDNVANISFSADDTNLSKHVSVGWGKSETQFKGKRAKSLHDPTLPEKIDEGTLSVLDKREVSVSWRGDGSFVAVNSLLDGIRRIIRVCSREGSLESVTEPVDGLEGSLSWRPAGNILAGVRRHKGETLIVFFERNGLRHGQFAPQLDPQDSRWTDSPITLAWNVDSSVLAIGFQEKVQLYVMDNYHYYLKQEVILPNNSSQPVAVKWHPEDPYRFSVSCRIIDKQSNVVNQNDHPPTLSQEVRDIRFEPCVDAGPVTPPEDYGVSAVIDGHVIKLTPLRIANVPPPMALHNLSLNHFVKDVAIDNINTCVAALHENCISLLHYDSKVKTSKPSVSRVVPIPTGNELNCRQICFWRQDLYVLLTDLRDGTDKIYHPQEDQLFQIPKLFRVAKLITSINQDSLYLACHEDESGLYPVVRLNDFIKSVDFVPLTDQILTKFPAFCPHVEIGIHGASDVAFGLTCSGALYANDKLLARDCTSFLMTDNHLLFTTTKHLLKFVHLTNDSEFEVPGDEPEIDERCRSIERGAKLVTVMPSIFAVVLQMPRGNLETIYPRALVLAGIRKSIDLKDYKAAFIACRKQRVDMNIIYDYAPAQFLSNVALFLDQLGKVEYVDLFLSQLIEEDVSQSMYKNTIVKATSEQNSQPISYEEGQLQLPPNSIKSSKINDICDTFISVLHSRMSSNMQNMITANVCKNPPNISAALLIITDLRSKQKHLVDQAVEHICFLVDVNLVYDNALGIYDLDLALLVAQQSQKDPREYIPYLQSLQKLSTLRRHFTIDNDLGRHKKALSHLHEMKALDEAMSYVDKHELYKDALEMYRYELDLQRKFLARYARFLSDTNRFKEAAIAFESLADFGAACSAYRAANMWEHCLSCAQSIPMQEEDFIDLAKSLSESLVESKLFEQAATIQFDYLNDVTSGVTNLCKDHKFPKAIRLVHKNRMLELLDTIVDPCVVEASATLAELLADCKSQLGAQIPRLRELRRMKAQNPLTFFEGMEDVNVPDNVSLAPSTTSTTGGTLFTRYTNQTGTINTSTTRKTSKNRRREERKRARGKKGSVYEEEYLVNSISRLIERMNSIGGDAVVTIETLLRRDMRERATVLDAAMTEVVLSCKSCLTEVFEVPTQNKVDAGENPRPQGAAGILWDSEAEERKGWEVPTVREYVRSELLI